MTIPAISSTLSLGSSTLSAGSSTLSEISDTMSDMSEDEPQVSINTEFDAEEIFDIEINWEAEKRDKCYYLGIYKYIPREQILLFVNSLSLNSFYKYAYESVRHYLYIYSEINFPKSHVHIMQLHILEDDTYTVVLKTHWLRLIQRTWKRTFAHRKAVLARRRTVSSILEFQRTGKYPAGLNYLPGITSMMYYLSNDNKYKN